jgi:hypothetical protein
MGRLQIGVVRYASVGAAIARTLGIQPAPDCRIGGGRVTIVFRRLEAWRWSETERITHALHAATVARSVLASDSRGAVRKRAGRAIVIVYEDASLARGCAVKTRWECVVPAE